MINITLKVFLLFKKKNENHRVNHIKSCHKTKISIPKLSGFFVLLNVNRMHGNFMRYTSIFYIAQISFQYNCDVIILFRGGCATEYSLPMKPRKICVFLLFFQNFSFVLLNLHNTMLLQNWFHCKKKFGFIWNESLL